jgi:hypothetical protein
VISTVDAAIIESSRPGWLSPDGEFHEVRSFTLGLPWPHAEYASTAFPDSDDPEREMERSGWWKCSIAYDGAMLHWSGGVSATDAQRRFLRTWARKWKVRVAEDDFVVAPLEDLPKVRRTRTDPPALPSPERPIVTSRRSEAAVYIDTLPVAGTIAIPIRVSEVNGRDLVGPLMRRTHSFAPLAADAGDEMHVAADFALGFHITRSKGGKTYHAHVSLEALARAVDEALQIVDETTLPMATTRSPEEH